MDKALASLTKSDNQPRRLDLKLQHLRSQAAKGVPLSRALSHQKLINAADVALLASAEAAGRLAEALRFVSDRNVMRAQQLSTFRAGLVLPLAILFIGAFAGVFIKVASGVALIEAVFTVARPLTLALFGIYLLARLLAVDIRTYLSLIWKHPLIWPVLERLTPKVSVAFEQCFYWPLLWQIQSGLRFDTAVNNNQALLANHRFKQAVIATKRQVSSGEELGLALVSNGLVLSPRLRQVLQVGQQTGRFEQAMSSELTIQQAGLDESFKQLLAWAPRVVYLLVLISVSRFIL